MLNKDILPNGIRVVTETVPHVQSISIGLWVDSGACDESEATRGISHFMEHMLFKGTENRTAKQIAQEFDSIGGQVNAFTEKESTCFYAKVLSEYLPVAVDVLSDMFLNSKLDEKEIELEKNVVLEEIKMHEDTPEDVVHDLYAATVWHKHPLGLAVLGDRNVVGGLKADDLRDFVRRRYTPDNLVVSAAGNLSHKDVVEKIEAVFGQMTGSKIECERTIPQFTPESLFAKKSTEQVQFCIGTPGYGHLDENRYTLAVVDTALGGGMSSRLFQEIRENRGLAYSIGSYSSSYRAGGLFTVFGGTSLETMEKVIDLIVAEFKSVRDENLTDEEMNRAKNQIRGGLILGQEGMSSRMIRLGRTELYYGRLMPLEELISHVVRVTREDVARVAEFLFNGPSFPTVAVGPFKA
jgi:predicted Zn-dependent peptidase